MQTSRRRNTWKSIRALAVAFAKPNHSRAGWLARNKDALGAAQSLVTIIAIGVAYIWFQGQHLAAPKLKIEHKLSNRPYLGQDKSDGEMLLTVQILITNVGSVSDYLDPGKVRIDEINPGLSRLFCDDVTDTEESRPCEGSQTPIRTKAATRMMENLKRSTPIGWFWSPNAARWIEPGETDEAYAGEYRLKKNVKTIRVGSVWSVGSGSYWKAIDYYDLVQPDAQSLNKP